MNNHHNITKNQVLSAALEGITIKLPHRDQLVMILSAALSAADPALAVKKNLCVVADKLIAGEHSFYLQSSTKIMTVALGKAAPVMLSSAIEQLGEWFNGGVCVGKQIDAGATTAPGTSYFIGNHPVPGEGSLQAGKAIRRAVTGLGRDDIVLLLVSGGGSSLATLPLEGVSLADLQELTTTLLRSGASIDELNTVRKHLDHIKGGGIVRLATPANVVALVLSDVVGNNLEVIASGPAYPDPTTFSDAMRVIRKASRYGSIPASVARLFEEGRKGRIPETLKADEPDARRGFNTIITSNVEACVAAAEQAKTLGFQAEIVTTRLIGEASSAGMEIIRLVKQEGTRKRPFALVFGGETTVTVRGSGKGGRNQELALAAVKEIAGMSNTLLVTFATDGEDGPTDAAGALVDGDSLSRAISLGLNPDDYLRNNDAYSFFNRMGDLIRTGATGTNVNDLTFVFGF